MPERLVDDRQGFAGYMTFASMVEWSIDGQTVWGEDHDSWPHSIFRSRFG